MQAIVYLTFYIHFLLSWHYYYFYFTKGPEGLSNLLKATKEARFEPKSPSYRVLAPPVAPSQSFLLRMAQTGE